jgi:hypothetical protein
MDKLPLDIIKIIAKFSSDNDLKYIFTDLKDSDFTNIPYINDMTRSIEERYDTFSFSYAFDWFRVNKIIITEESYYHEGLKMSDIMVYLRIDADDLKKTVRFNNSLKEIKEKLDKLNICNSCTFYSSDVSFRKDYVILCSQNKTLLGL